MAKVFVVGSLHYDIVMRAPRLPAIDETVMGDDVQYVCGGKGGNQAVAASRNGGEVSFAGAVGTDAAAETLVANLDAADVNTEQVQRVSQASGMSVAIVDARGDYGAVVASGANQSILADHVSVPADTACIVLQNEVPEAVNLAVARRSGSARVILNAAPMRALSPELLERTDILIVNKVEAEALFDTSVSSTVEAAAALTATDQPAPCVVITLGANGLVYRDRDGEPQTILAYEIEAVSSHGAGDAFVGAFAAKIANGATLSDAMTYASATAALWVSTAIDERSALDGVAVERFLTRRV